MSVVGNGAAQSHMRRQVFDAARVATANFGKRKKLDLCTEAIANGTTEETGMELDRPQSVMSTMGCHKTLLHLGLDRPRPRGAHDCHGFAC